MPLLETVKNMQTQGLQDTEIIQKLQEQGFDPREINDSINQSKIKAAVSGGYETSGQESVINNAPTSEMQPSVMSQQQEQQPQAQPQQQEQQQEQQIPQQAQQQYIYPAETYSPQTGQYNQEYYQPQSQGMGSEAITEIADQIFSEKVSDIKKSLILLADFKTITEAKVSALDFRLKKIETIIEKLQSSIIGRVGEFGQAVSEIKDEMSMMQESFSKVVNQAVSGKMPVSPVSEQVSKENQETREERPQEQRQVRKKQKDGFENYLAR